MKINLLLDLDDTLLHTNLDRFLPEYFKKLAWHVRDIVPTELFLASLTKSTRIMYSNINPLQTLEQVFNDSFYPQIGKKQSELSETIEDFYDNIFPELQYITKPNSEAIEFVEWAFSQGHGLCIATDPLFPRKAILHRLRWAGLDPVKYPFNFISDFHNFHFAKSSVFYYPELLAQLNWIDEPVLMVGDSMDRDVIPSQLSGIPVYWLNYDSDIVNQVKWQGNFLGLRVLLNSDELLNLKVDYRTPQALLSFLYATPAFFHSILLKNDPEGAMWMDTQYSADDWTITEVICHLRDIDDEVNLIRVVNILMENIFSITGTETNHWRIERNYRKQDPVIALREFSKKRMELIRLIKGMPDKNWDIKLQHSLLGPINFRELIQIIVDHDRLHIQQVYTKLLH